MAAIIYSCARCGFVFERAGLVDVCPNCGSASVHEAAREAREKYVRARENRREKE